LPDKNNAKRKIDAFHEFGNIEAPFVSSVKMNCSQILAIPAL